jgi:hypothetical protein
MQQEISRQSNFLVLEEMNEIVKLMRWWTKLKKNWEKFRNDVSVPNLNDRDTSS